MPVMFDYFVLLRIDKGIPTKAVYLNGKKEDVLGPSSSSLPSVNLKLRDAIEASGNSLVVSIPSLI